MVAGNPRKIHIVLVDAVNMHCGWGARGGDNTISATGAAGGKAHIGTPDGGSGSDGA